jgi:hypothetical protein
MQTNITQPSKKITNFSAAGTANFFSNFGVSMLKYSKKPLLMVFRCHIFRIATVAIGCQPHLLNPAKSNFFLRAFP